MWLQMRGGGGAGPSSAAAGRGRHSHRSSGRRYRCVEIRRSPAAIPSGANPRPAWRPARPLNPGGLRWGLRRLPEACDFNSFTRSFAGMTLRKGGCRTQTPQLKYRGKRVPESAFALIREDVAWETRLLKAPRFRWDRKRGSRFRFYRASYRKKPLTLFPDAP